MAERSIDPPRWPFAKGALAGALVVLPALALTVWAMASLGFGPPGLGLVQATRTAAIFGGAAAILTAGGIGRLAAEASAAAGGNLARASWVAARTQALASAGLVIIAALPHGHVPSEPWRWGVLALAGAFSGALAGIVIGLACGVARPVVLADVMALARWPQEAIRRAIGDDEESLPEAPIEVPAPRPASAKPRAATEGTVPRIDRDPTPLPVPVPLGQTGTVAAMTPPPRPASLAERHDPTPLPAPMPLGETVPTRAATGGGETGGG